MDIINIGNNICQDGLDKIFKLLDYKYMNPNLGTLDPKLKETYDRVMGADVGARLQGEAADKGGTSSQPDQKTQPAPQVQPTKEVHLPVEHNAAVPTPPPATPEPAPQEESQTEMVNINATVSQAKPAAVVSKKKSSPVIFIVAGVGFFLLYTVIWLKVFKLF